MASDDDMLMPSTPASRSSEYLDLFNQNQADEQTQPQQQQEAQQQLHADAASLQPQNVASMQQQQQTHAELLTPASASMLSPLSPTSLGGSADAVHQTCHDDFAAHLSILASPRPTDDSDDDSGAADREVVAQAPASGRHSAHTRARCTKPHTTRSPPPHADVTRVLDAARAASSAHPHAFTYLQTRVHMGSLGDEGKDESKDESMSAAAAPAVSLPLDRPSLHPYSRGSIYTPAGPCTLEHTFALELCLSPARELPPERVGFLMLPLPVSIAPLHTPLHIPFKMAVADAPADKPDRYLPRRKELKGSSTYALQWTYNQMIIVLSHTGSRLYPPACLKANSDDGAAVLLCPTVKEPVLRAELRCFASHGAVWTLDQGATEPILLSSSKKRVSRDRAGFTVSMTLLHQPTPPSTQAVMAAPASVLATEVAATAAWPVPSTPARPPASKRKSEARVTAHQPRVRATVAAVPFHSVSDVLLPVCWSASASSSPPLAPTPDVLRACLWTLLQQLHAQDPDEAAEDLTALTRAGSYRVDANVPVQFLQADAPDAVLLEVDQELLMQRDHKFIEVFMKLNAHSMVSSDWRPTCTAGIPLIPRTVFREHGAQALELCCSRDVVSAAAGVESSSSFSSSASAPVGSSCLSLSAQTVGDLLCWMMYVHFGSTAELIHWRVLYRAFLWLGREHVWAPDARRMQWTMGVLAFMQRHQTRLQEFILRPQSQRHPLWITRAQAKKALQSDGDRQARLLRINEGHLQQTVHSHESDSSLSAVSSLSRGVERMYIRAECEPQLVLSFQRASCGHCVRHGCMLDRVVGHAGVHLLGEASDAERERQLLEQLLTKPIEVIETLFDDDDEHDDDCPLARRSGVSGLDVERAHAQLLTPSSAGMEEADDVFAQAAEAGTSSAFATAALVQPVPSHVPGPRRRKPPHKYDKSKHAQVQTPDSVLCASDQEGHNPELSRA